MHIFFFSISTGHWNEDPCEFTALGIQYTDEAFLHFLNNYRASFTDDLATIYGLTASFISCAAVAHNQGNVYNV